MLTIRQFTFNPLQENTYLIFDENKHCLIIDPGCYFENEREELIGFIDQWKLVPKTLLNTHCHLDHIFGNRFVAAKYHLQPHIHAKEQPVFDQAEQHGRQWGLPFDNYTGNLAYLTEGKDVMLGEARLQVLFTPGHSPGSVSFYCADEQFVIAGDVLFRHGIGRTDLPGGDFSTLLHSIREKLFVLPEAVRVFPGHGPETTIGEEKSGNPFLTA